MTVTLRRQIDDTEKARVLEIHGSRCYATGHLIPADETPQFDHIRAHATGGDTSVENIAPMCATHNKEKGTLCLEDFRVKLALRDFFGTRDRLTLRDLLEHLHGRKQIAAYGQSVAFEEHDGTVKISNASDEFVHTLYACPTTGWKYFYATLPVSVLDSDDDADDAIGLQPRYLIFERVFDLYRHFKQHPVLQPAIGRVVGSKLRLFDGQHKLAALLWNNRSNFECKIYLAPDLRLLNQTNIAAHDKYAQARFFSSIMIMKLGTQFGRDFETYRALEDDGQKSEAGFIDHLRRLDANLSKGDISERFRSFLYDAVLKHEENEFANLVSTTNRGTDERPLTLDLLTKSIFSNFMYREPVSDNMATEAYKRADEIENIVFLLNTLHKLALSKWSARRAPNDNARRRLDRMIRSKSMMAWAEIVRDATLAKLDLLDQEDRVRPFYRKMTDAQRAAVTSVVERLVAWKMWDSPEDAVDRVLSDNKSEVKKWFREKGLTSGYLLGAPE